MMLLDAQSRPIKDLRISVTDRCNFRCTYCMPLDDYPWLDRRQLLSFDEITRLTRIFAGLGVTKIRITGGEPLMRKDLPALIQMLASVDGLRDICLTTNGSLLSDQAGALARAGLKRINVSLDTLDRDRFRRMTKRGDLDRVLAGLHAARASGLDPIKLNAVIEAGVNDDDIIPLARFARENGYHLRFIEFMDVGTTNQWTSAQVMPKRDILRIVGSHFPLQPSVESDATSPSADYCYADGAGRVGVIASMTEPFCTNCTRARLTADGKLVTCLFSMKGHDLKLLLRDGADDETIRATITRIWRGRTDRFSDQRLEAINSDPGYHPAEHPKMEMISLGG